MAHVGLVTSCNVLSWDFFFGYTRGTSDLFTWDFFSSLPALSCRPAALSSVPLSLSLSVSVYQEGYATPKLDGRAAVFHKDKLLLVKERSDGGWTMPGGWADVLRLTPLDR